MHYHFSNQWRYPYGLSTFVMRGRRGLDRMVVGFTTTYAISVYHHWCFEFESRSGRDVQHYVIKSVTCDRSVFFGGTPVFSINKTDRHNIAEILLKVALTTITLTRILQPYQLVLLKGQLSMDKIMCLLNIVVFWCINAWHKSIPVLPPVTENFHHITLFGLHIPMGVIELTAW
jgi:hypothetical protein